MGCTGGRSVRTSAGGRGLQQLAALRAPIGVGGRHCVRVTIPFRGAPWARRFVQNSSSGTGSVHRPSPRLSIISQTRPRVLHAHFRLGTLLEIRFAHGARPAGQW